MNILIRTLASVSLAAACAVPAVGQDAPNKPVAPDQDAVERARTAELNAEVAARNEAAAATEASARADYEAAVARQAEAEAAYAAAAAEHAAAVAEAEATHQTRMEVWRAQVVACENGVRLACVPVQPRD